MPKFYKRKICEKPFACPGSDYTSDFRDESSDTSSLIQEKNIALLPNMDLNAISAVFAVDVNNTNIPVISHLAELEAISDDALMQVFWENRETIFAYSSVDIEATLAKKDLEVLKLIRVHLCDLAGKLFPTFDKKVLINRKAKNKVAHDIFHLGYSIINKSFTKEMENVYQKESGDSESITDETGNDTTDLAQLLIVVTNMKTDIKNNSKEIDLLKAENKDLLVQLKATQCKCGDNCQVRAPKENIHTVAEIHEYPKDNLCTVGNSNNTIDVQHPVSATLGSVSTNIGSKAPPTMTPMSEMPNTSNLDQAQAPVLESNQLLLQKPKERRLRDPTRLQSSTSSFDSNDSDAMYIQKVYRKRKALQKKQQAELNSKINPIKAAKTPDKKVDMFIGNIDKSNTIEDLINHMNTFNIVVNTADIVEIPQRSENKAFKVTLSTSHVEALKVIWPDRVKVDNFRTNKPVNAAPRSNKYATNNREQRPKQPFRRPVWQNQSNQGDWDNWRDYGNEWPSLSRSNYMYDNSWERSKQAEYNYREYPYYYTY